VTASAVGIYLGQGAPCSERERPPYVSSVTSSHERPEIVRAIGAEPHKPHTLPLIERAVAARPLDVGEVLEVDASAVSPASSRLLAQPRGFERLLW
jgi:hypothetical protein